jgi:exonuclease SbcC
MIKKIRLVNWKSHIDSEFEFSEGVNVLIGIMGSGKTSVMQAISFALYGTFPALQSRKISLDDLIMRKPQKKGRAEIHLTFSLGGKDYSIMRAIEAGKGTVEAEIRESGRVINVNAQGVTDEVVRTLRMNYELFSRAVYAEQNNLDYFLSIPKGQRMDHIDRMLMLDRFEKARENAVSLSNRVRQTGRDLSRIVEDMEKENLRERWKRQNEDLAGITEKATVLKDKDEALGNRTARLSETLSVLEESERELNRLSTLGKGLESSIEEIGKSLDEKRGRLSGRKPSKGRLEKIEAGIRRLQKGIDEKREKEKKSREQIAVFNSRIAMLREETGSLREGIPSQEIVPDMEALVIKELGEKPEVAVREMEKGFEKSRGALYEIQAKRESVLKHTEHLKGAEVNCPVCDSIIEETKRVWLVGERERELKEISARITGMVEENRKTQERIDKAKGMLEELSSYQEKIRSLKETKERLDEKERELASLREYVGSSAGELEKIKKDLTRDENDLEKLRAGRDDIRGFFEEASLITDLEKRLGDKTKERAEILEKARGFSETLEKNDIGEVRKDLQDSVAERKGIEAERKGLSQSIDEKRVLLSDIEKRIELFRKYRNDVKESETISGMLRGFADVMGVTQDQLRQEFLKTVNRIMERVWEEVYPYGDFSSVRLIIDRDYVLQLRDRERWVNVEGIVSGGERSIASLALRVAFSLAFIPNLKWLILDEPTHNLDDSAIEKLGGILGESMGSFSEQVFIITHEERLAETITGSAYKLERDKASDGATRVTKG